MYSVQESEEQLKKTQKGDFMNRFIAVSLSAAILFTNGTAASAKEKVRDEQPVIITETKAPETAEDFIKAYAGCTIQITKDKKTADEFVWYESADEQNYLLLLEGREILKILPEDVQKEISDAYLKQDISYEKLMEQAEAIDQEIKDKAAKEQEAKKAAQTKNDSVKTESSREESADSEKTSEPAAQKPAEKNDSSSAPEQEAQRPAAQLPQSSQGSVQENNNESSLSSGNNNNNNNNESHPAEPAKTQPETVSPDPSQPQSGKEDQTSTDDRKSETQDKGTPDQDIQDNSADNPSKPAGEILYQSSLTSGSLGSITFTASGNRIESPDQNAPQIAEAVRSYLKSDAEETSSADLYEDVVFYSENKDLSASSETMMAARTPEKTVFFDIRVDEEAKSAVITPKNPASISIDYNTQAITLKNEAPFETEISAEESEPKQESKNDTADNSSSQENIEAPEILELPSKPVLMMKPQPAGNLSVSEEKTGLQTPAVPEETEELAAPEQNINSEPAAETQKPVLFDTVKEEAAKSAAAEIQKKAADPIQTGSVQSSAQPAEKKNAAVGGITADARLNSSAVSSFISRYCSNAQGLIYLQAWSANYQQIMSGYSVWRTLDAADKQAINQRLAEVGSPSFTALYRQAHRISLGLGIGSSSTQIQRPAVNKTPATGNAEHGMTYSFITVFSAFLAALFLRKSFQRENEQNSN